MTTVAMRTKGDPSEHDTIDLARQFSMLGDPTRLSILTHLATGPKPVNELCEAVGISQPLVSHHLGLLRMSRLVTAQRNGKSVIYSLPNSRTHGSKVTLTLD